MWKALLGRIEQGHRTIGFPKGPEPEMPDRFRGRPVIDSGKCPEGCRECMEACPTGAISIEGAPRIDLGRCLFCTECTAACPEQAIAYSREFRLATSRREDLVVSGQAMTLARSLDEKTRKLFGRSLKLRQVSAGGCNGCESDVNVLNTVVFDLGRFGIQFVASPRHADGLLITGPVTRNMELALRKTYEAVPAPKGVADAIVACPMAQGTRSRCTFPGSGQGRSAG